MMKKTLWILLIACIGFGTSSQAASVSKSFGYLDTKGSIFVPIAFLKTLDIEVGWDAQEQRIDLTKEDSKLSVYIGKSGAVVNDTTVQLTEIPYIDHGIKYVPLRFVTGNLDMKQEWIGATASVTVTLNKQAVAELPIIKPKANPYETKPIVMAKKTFKVGGRSFAVQMVKVALMNPKVSLGIALAKGEVGKVDELNNLAKANGAILAINGSFFDAYTDLDYKVPYGNVISKSELLHNALSDRRTMFTFDDNNLVKLIAGRYYKEHYKQISIVGGVQAGPRLIMDGKISLNVAEEGFRDPKILTGGGARSAIGMTRDHELIMLTTGGATIPQLAELMKQAGAYQAMNLDGGASSGLYYDGQYLTKPGRQISNAIIVKLN
ncbi:phosphodiester glycosidase family protein [Cohnella lupini]|uniref:Copper amine oxidase-like protein n=1 Tax=Cohnella lupini TaxID=1294267 RepID=A0A3D9HQY3_9BACL|nr:phosphodiester glycosidase family protein [Cohnella lupini]RED51888.1 copper amine oxidase-like protein [Cohnella lupini]